MLADRLPPQNVEIEAAILGACILNKEALLTAIEKIYIEDFYLDNHRVIYMAMLKLSNDGIQIDSVSLCNILREQGNLEKVGGHQEIINLHKNTSSVNIKSYIKKLKEYSKRRKIINSSSETINDSYNIGMNIDDVISNMNNNFVEIASQDNEACLPIKDIVYSEEEVGECVKTGYESIDKWIYGLFRQELTVIGARPSVGKSALALNIAENVAQRENVLFFSCEMPAKHLVYRMIARKTGLPFRIIQEKKYKGEDIDRVENAKKQISLLKMHIDDTPNINIDKLVAIAKQKKNLGLIGIDYVQLISSSLSGGRDERLTDVSRKIKQVARDCNCPVLELSQLNRSVDSRSDPQPYLSDLRESGAIEQDADSVIFLWEYPDNKGVKELTVAKQRNGPLGTFSMMFEPVRILFSDIN